MKCKIVLWCIFFNCSFILPSSSVLEGKWLIFMLIWFKHTISIRKNLSNDNNLFNFKILCFLVPLGVLCRWFFHYQNWYWRRTYWSWYQNCSSLERGPNWVRRGEKDQRGRKETFPIHWISHQTSCWEGAWQRSFWRRGRWWQNGGNCSPFLTNNWKISVFLFYLLGFRVKTFTSN